MQATQKSNHFLSSLFNKYYYSMPNVYEYKKYKNVKSSKAYKVVLKYPWTNILFNDSNLKISGWKIHISSKMEEYEDVLDIIFAYCMENEIDFKFVNTKEEYYYLNGKSVSRLTANKNIVIYPEEEIFRKVIEEVYVLTKQYQGAYIVTDMKYKDSNVVYYRYGEVNPIRRLSERGYFISYILDDSGKEIMDIRKPCEYKPNWVSDIVELTIEEEDSIFLKKYHPIKSLYFSSSGGVYLVKNKAGELKIAKEARAFTSIDNNLKYATDRLLNEYNFLERLKDTKITPEPIEFIQDQGNCYLIEEIEGISLREYVYTRNPFLTNDSNKERIGKYFDTVNKIFENLKKAILTINSKDVILGDISDNNILIEDIENSCRIRIIDLETSRNYSDSNITAIHTPGLGNTRTDLDRVYYLGLEMILPINIIYDIDDSKKYALLYWFSEQGYSNLSFFKDLKKYFSLIEVTKSKNNLLDRSKLKKIVESILLSFDSETYFPADPHVFITNKFSIAHGAVGVLKSIEYTLDNIDEDVNDDLKNVKKYILEAIYTNKENNIPLGFSMGYLGVLSYYKEKKLLENYVNTNDLINEVKQTDLFYGKSGILLGLVYNKYVGFEINEDLILSLGKEIADISFEEEELIGLHTGLAGNVLALLSVYMHTKDLGYLNICKEMLSNIVDNLMIDNFDNITLNKLGKNSKIFVATPFLYDGLAGVGHVVLLYTKITKEETYTKILYEIVESLLYKAHVFSCLMRGLSGITDFLISYLQEFGDKIEVEKRLEIEKVVESQINTLSLYEIEEGSSVRGFVGEQLLRISHDYYTGTAGVIAVISRYMAYKNKKYTYSSDFTVAMLEEIIKEEIL